MFAVIFEVEPLPGRQPDYLALAATLREHLQRQPGFISVERFQSLSTPGKLLSLSFWKDEASIAAWRQLDEHRQAQAAGRQQIFADYRLRIAEVVRDYGLHQREQAPADSRCAHEQGTSR